MVKKIKFYMFSVLSGAALVFCFPPYDLWWLAFLSLAPFFYTLFNASSSGKAFKIGIVMGFVFFLGTQYWIYNSIHFYGHLSRWLSILVIICLALYQSLYTGIFGFLFRFMLNGTSLTATLVAPLIWVVLEYLKSYIITGFPWSSIGYSQYLNLSFIQVADLGGVYLISLLVVAVNAALADLFILKLRRREMPLFNLVPTMIGYTALLLVISFVLLYGNYRLSQVRLGKELRVGIVQGNIEQDKKWDSTYQNETLDIYETDSRKASSFKPDLIVWPESALPFYLGMDNENTWRLFAFQRFLNIPLLTGAVMVNPLSDGGYNLSNSAILLIGKNKPSYRYDKVHLVPFGEYVPLKNLLFFVNRMVEGIGDFVPGDNFQRGRVSGQEFGTAICYEIIFPGLVRTFFKDGGDFLVTITNDAWFGRSPGPYQHFAMSVFRAVENRKPLIRAANSGISGFVDSSGRIIDASSLFTRTILTRSIRTDKTRTFYTRYGDLVPYFCIILCIFIFANTRRRQL